jgi:plasmid stabilization system protein ParE
VKPSVIFSPAVKSDLKDAQIWYKKINSKLALSFLDDYKNKLKYLSENPSTLELRYENQRICFLDRFPYGIHYEFVEKLNIIRVYAVLHTSQNPKIWMERK